MTATIIDIEDLLNQGRYFEARAKAVTLLSDTESLRARQLYALSMSKCGVPEAAMQYLEPVYAQFPDDPETAGILGAIYKELFIKTKMQRYAVLSRDTYLKNFRATKSYYTGINAATMSVIAGQTKQGQQIASEVIGLLQEHEQGFWEIATRAEAFLISKDRTKAKDHYMQARSLIATDWGKVNSIYNQLWLLNHYMAVPKELLDIFKPPVVVAFVGHMIDHPSRAQSRFPPDIENKIKDAITGGILSLNAKIGYCSLACGSDILFAEAMAETGGEVNIFLPFQEADFIETSLRFAGDDWVRRYEALAKKFPVSFITQEPYGGYDDLFFLQAGIIFGAAAFRSSSSHTKGYLMSVLSLMDLKKKEGGARDTIKLWPYQQNTLNINPDNFNNSPRVSEPKKLHEFIHLKKYENRSVSYLLLADFPDTSADERNSFWKKILPRIEMQSPLPTGLIWNGDVILVTYNSIAGVLELSQILDETVKRFHKKENLRISFHVGPVFTDPQEISIGNRIEGNEVDILHKIHSYSAPGEVVASSQLSMELALDVEHYTIQYAGKFASADNLHHQEIFRIDFLD